MDFALLDSEAVGRHVVMPDAVGHIAFHIHRHAAFGHGDAALLRERPEFAAVDVLETIDAAADDEHGRVADELDDVLAAQHHVLPAVEDFERVRQFAAVERKVEARPIVIFGYSEPVRLVEPVVGGRLDVDRHLLLRYQLDGFQRFALDERPDVVVVEFDRQFVEESLHRLLARKTPVDGLFAGLAQDSDDVGLGIVERIFARGGHLGIDRLHQFEHRCRLVRNYVWHSHIAQRYFLADNDGKAFVVVVHSGSVLGAFGMQWLYGVARPRLLNHLTISRLPMRRVVLRDMLLSLQMFETVVPYFAASPPSVSPERMVCVIR